MNPTDPTSSRALDRTTFLLLLVGLTLALAVVVAPFIGAVFWGAVLALMFEPLYKWLLRKMPKRPTLAAIFTLAIILFIVILPLALVTASLVQEVAGVMQRFKAGEIDFGKYFDQIVAVLPSWATGVMDNLGLDNLAALQAKVTTAITQRSQVVATRAVDIGQEVLDLTISFSLAMYLLFFLLRDGPGVADRIEMAIPLAPEIKTRLLERFTIVIRATVKGNILVAAAQGALGGIAFWALGIHAPILWAVVMAFLSLLPAIGAALIWGPVSLYLLAIGQIWQGVALIAFGVFVIGLVDNVLRPVLVGKDTKLPDYVVLISTIGGISVFGLNGFVIGPVIAAMFVSAWSIFAASRGESIADAPVRDGGAVAAEASSPDNPPVVGAAPNRPSITS